MNKLLKTIFVVACLVASLSTYAEIERVKVIVTNDRHALLPNVNIQELENRKIVGMTDNNGEAVIDVIVGKKVHFLLEEYSGRYKKKEIVLDGSVATFKVMLEKSKDIQIGEVKIAGKLEERKRLQPRPSITKIKGDTIMTTCQFPIDTLLHKDVRVIVQPFFLDSTLHKKYYTEPFVLDGKEYHKTQIRMYDYRESSDFNDAIPAKILRSPNPVLDPLYNNIVERNDSLHYIGKTKSRSFKVKDKFYNDSIVYRSYDVAKSKWGILTEVPMKLVANTKVRNEHFWCAGAVVSFEDYNKIIYIKDGDLFSIGLRNPMRFFEYDLKGTELKEDSAIWYPTPNLAKQEKADQIHIRFAKAKSDIDMSDSLTLVELGKLKQSIDVILSDEDAEFRDVTIIGTASPEGKFAYNQKLAGERMGTLLNWVRERIPEAKRVHMYPQKEGRVAKWKEVAELLKKDNKQKEAEEVESIIAKYSSEDKRGSAIRKLAYYQMIEDKYLPQLRKVEYKLGYSIDRVMTYEDIVQRLETNSSFVPSAYESFLLYRNEKDLNKRLELCKKAYETHPNYLVFANDYAALLISAHKANPAILNGYDVDKIKQMGRNHKVPVTVHINQMCARLLTDNVIAADTLDQMIMARTDCNPASNKEFVKAHTYLEMKQGDFSDENYEKIKGTGLRNEILFLLARNSETEDATADDKRAFKMSEGLSDSSAINCVIKAICASRVNGKDNRDVVDYLKKSFALDPTMEQQCSGEADLQKALATIKKERNATQQDANTGK